MSVSTRLDERGTLDALVRAMLYEGYVLYPYRASSTKNRQRFTFGALYPREWCAKEPSDRSQIQIEVLAVGRDPVVTIGARFLRLFQAREDWHEAEEKTASLPAHALSEETPLILSFDYDVVHAGSEHVSCAMHLHSTRLREDLYRVRVVIENTTPLGAATTRDAALVRSLASTHAILEIENGSFVSLLETPADLTLDAKSCQNEGVWPVLVGAPGERTTMLASPIILYDYPKLAPESRGDLFDATEIDEILTLRILTLTDEEKAAVRATDPRARALLDRTEALTPQDLARMHGRKSKVSTLSVGDHVVIDPKGRADAFDVVLKGKRATVCSVEEDLEGRVFAAVTIDCDPGKDLGLTGKPGHRFFFQTNELVKVGPRILVAGIGNVFFGDDGFGVEVAKRLLACNFPLGVDVVDFGIRGHDLGFALTSGYEMAILIDATKRGGSPGALYVLDLDDVILAPVLDTHAMDPAKVLGLARAMGTLPKTLRLIGCEPKHIPETEDDLTTTLSEEATLAVVNATALIREMIDAAQRVNHA